MIKFLTSNYNIFIFQKIILLTFVLKFINIKSLQNFKSIYLSNDCYLIVRPENITIFNNIYNNTNHVYQFVDDQIITTTEESEMISFGVFKNDSISPNLLVVKNYIYAIQNQNHLCNFKLRDIYRYSEVYPYQCINYFCFYIIGIVNSNKELYLYLYKNPADSCKSDVVSNFTINNIYSNNLSCQFMINLFCGNVLTCFYQNNNSEIISISFNINITSYEIKPIQSLTKQKSNNGAIIIKSILSQDRTKSLVCYISNDNNCNCLIYYINTNEWDEYSTYLNNCSINFSSLNIEYFDISNEYILYCLKSSSELTLVKLDLEFNIKEDEKNGFYDLTSTLSKCGDYYLSSLIYDSNNINILANCNGDIIKYEVKNSLPSTTIPLKTSLIRTFPTLPKKFTNLMTTIFSTFSKTSTPTKTIKSTIIESTLILKKTTKITILSQITLISNISILDSNNNNKIVIIKDKSIKTKEEIMENLDKIMEDYDIGIIYEIFGDDYNVKISPINIKTHDNISTYIDFSNCENILREDNHLNTSSIITVYQIEIYNSNEQSLINNVEYAVYNENKEKLDLSVCKDELIIINYQINTSMINVSKINYYSSLGIDIFNIEDQFFNDICYSYSEGDSDMILKDRVTDIYQNYSVCESNCKYNNINITEKTVSCYCRIKTYDESHIHPPRLDKIIRDSFTNSNLAVIKCYNLVFSYENKSQNIGFWIFSILVFLHFPIFIYYFIFNISSIKNFILTEMAKFNYIRRVDNPIKRDKNIKKTRREKKAHIKNEELENKNTKIMSINNSSITKIIQSNFNSSLKKNRSNPNLNTNFNFLNPNKIINHKNKHKSMKSIAFKISNNKNRIKMKSHHKTHSTKKKISIYNEKINDKQVLSSKCYSLIQIDANNSINKRPPNSDFILDNYDYETALIYDNRKFWRIFYISILAKENIINIILFKTPLDIRPLRICLFIFSYSCDLAFNTIFFTNQNISDKYHYEGNNLFLFTLINNSIISIISSLVGLILVNIFQHMIDARGDFEDIFRNEEKKMRENKKYKVSRKRKSEILKNIKDLYLNLKNKIIFFIIFEFSIMLFFYYFVTSFCEVYKKTQISWLSDFFSSFFISFGSEIIGALIITIFYIFSIRYKLKYVYNVVLFFYNL